MRRIHRRRHKKHVFFRLAAIFLIIAILLIFCDMQFRPAIKRKVRDCARIETTVLLNRALLMQIEEQNISYSDLVHIRYGNDGIIASIEIDTVAVNKFKSAFALSVSDALQDIEKFRFSLPLGTLIGPEFLSECGPAIPFNVCSTGTVRAEIESHFEQAGINQTLHRLVLSVSVNICCYFPGYLTSAGIQTQLPLAETVIIGSVPRYYSGGN